MKIDWKKIWKKVPGIIRHDFVRKLLAFILAAIVFFPLKCSISKEQQMQKDDTPVDEIEVITPDTVFVPDKTGKQVKLIRAEDKNPVFSVVIKKSIWAYFWFSKNNAEYILNKKKAFKRKFAPNQPYKIRISKENIIPPFGIEIYSGFKDIIYEQYAEKSVEVKPDLRKNELHSNYVVEKVTVSPEKITVFGPGSIIKTLEFVKTGYVPLRNITQSFDYSAELVRSSTRLRFSPDKVFVHVSIKENIKEREFKLQKIRIMNDNSKLMCEIIGSPYANVTVKGTKDRIDALFPNQIKPYIDIFHLNSPGIYSVELGCWISEKSLEVMKIEPQSVKVKISKK